MADKDLHELRLQIDDIDNRILDLLNQRARVVLEVGSTKTDSQQDFYVPSREQSIYERLAARNPGPFPTEAIRRVYREIISASLSLEHPLKVAYLGPLATFTHSAALQQFGLSAQLVAQKSIAAVFDEVQRGRADYGVVPVENSNEGVVSHTLDMFMESDLQIIAEILLEISHDLLSASGNMVAVKKVVSHPQALAQCRRWLEDNLPEVPLVDVASTALAAQIAAASDGNISLEALELLDYEEELDHASFTVSLRLSGDLQEGLLSALEGIGAELTPPVEAEEVPPLSMESIDYHVSFNGAALLLEADIGGTLSGDFNGQMNIYKDMSLKELLESDELDDEDKTLVARALPIDLHVRHLLIEATSSFGEDSATSTFSVDGLGLEPPSFEALMDFLEELSRRGSLEDFKLVLLGESNGNQYVAFTVSEGASEPVLEEEGKVVWDMDDVENLDDVTYEVKTRGLGTTTLVAASAIGLVVIGAAGYMFMKNR